MCICVLEVLPLSMIFILYFVTVWVFVFFRSIINFTSKCVIGFTPVQECFHKLYNFLDPTSPTIIPGNILFDVYVVNQKLEHFDDISFRELFGRIIEFLSTK